MIAQPINSMMLLLLMTRSLRRKPLPARIFDLSRFVLFHKPILQTRFGYLKITVTVIARRYAKQTYSNYYRYKKSFHLKSQYNVVVKRFTIMFYINNLNIIHKYRIWRNPIRIASHAKSQMRRKYKVGLLTFLHQLQAFV